MVQSCSSSLSHSRQAIAAIVLAAWPAIVLAQGANVTVEQQVKDLKAQLELVQEQVKLNAAQQTADAALAKALAEALKGQISAESELEKTKAQAEFAKLAGIKAGLDSVGAPPGKEGKITISSGTAGALLLRLKKPMIEGLQAAARQVLEDIRTPAADKSIVLASDADVQAAVQAQVTFQALTDAVVAIRTPREALDAKSSMVAAATGLEAVAAAGLVMKTFTDFSKFFRSDVSMSAFDAGEEANHLLRLFLERALSLDTATRSRLVRIDELVPTLVIEEAKKALELVNGLRHEYQSGANTVAAAEKLAPAEQKKLEPELQRLRDAVAIGKELLDALHPARKPDGFWTFASGRYKDLRLANGVRLVLNAKAQSVQVVKSRVFGADKIEGHAGVQVDYRLVSTGGDFLAGRAFLMTLDAPAPSTSGTAPTLEPIPAT